MSSKFGKQKLETGAERSCGDRREKNKHTETFSPIANEAATVRVLCFSNRVFGCQECFLCVLCFHSAFSPWRRTRGLQRIAENKNTVLKLRHARKKNKKTLGVVCRILDERFISPVSLRQLELKGTQVEPVLVVETNMP